MGIHIVLHLENDEQNTWNIVNIVTGLLSLGLLRLLVPPHSYGTLDDVQCMFFSV